MLRRTKNQQRTKNNNRDDGTLNKEKTFLASLRNSDICISSQMRGGGKGKKKKTCVIGRGRAHEQESEKKQKQT